MLHEELAIAVAARERLLPAVVKVHDALRVAVEYVVEDEGLDARVHAF